METEEGLVTVIIPVYNAGPYLKASIDSILTQTYTRLAIFICNDGSTDQSGTILDTYTDPRIRRFYNEKNLGCYRSVSKMMGYTRCDYIALHDADDISHPDRIRQQVEFLRTNREIDLVGTNYSIINTRGKVVATFPVMMDNPELIPDALMARNEFQKSSILFRRRVYERFGGYRDALMPNKNIIGDYDWILQASEGYLLSNINSKEPLYQYRSVAHSMTKRYTSLDQHLAPKMARYLATERRLEYGTDSLMRRNYLQIEQQLEFYKIPYEDDPSLFHFERATSLMEHRLPWQALRHALIAVLWRPYRCRNLMCLYQAIKMLALPMRA
jgi:glycosyltransferase involved in cell wall biosynthesis